MPVETPEFGAMVKRMLRAYGRRVAVADEVDLAELVTLREALEAAIADAVAGQRKEGRSWAYVARGLGVTRQAAQIRYGKHHQPRWDNDYGYE